MTDNPRSIFFAVPPNLERKNDKRFIPEGPPLLQEVDGCWLEMIDGQRSCLMIRSKSALNLRSFDVAISDGQKTLGYLKFEFSGSINSQALYKASQMRLEVQEEPEKKSELRILVGPRQELL